ncbi:hypothetical protein [Mycobacterium lepromatosis]|uniref:hypothetical protein n=1 Tax=Mycobacterium lepromatosis TaxID=480418 RepID=UPI000B2B9E02|nr:hypothetical protein [Mycobacterium lepromatosis]
MNAAGEDTFTYGLLFQLEANLADRCREQFDAALSKTRQGGAQKRGVEPDHQTKR